MIKKYSKEKQQEVITAEKQGATLKEISFRTGVSITTIKKWLSDSVRQGVAGIRIRRYFSTDEQKMILEEYEKHASCDVFDALGQVIFNAIDSSAQKVEIFFEYVDNGLDPKELPMREISCIRVQDDGDGIPFDSAASYLSLHNTESLSGTPDWRSFGTVPEYLRL